MKQKIRKIVEMLSAIFCIITITFTTYSPVVVYAGGIGFNASGAAIGNMGESGLHLDSVVGLSEKRYDGENTGETVRFGNHIIYDYWVEGSREVKDADYYCLRGETPVSYSQTYGYRVSLTEDTENRTANSIMNEIGEDGTGSYIVFKDNDSIMALQWLVKNMYCVSGSNDDTTKGYMRDNLQNIINAFAGSDKVSTTEHVSEETIGVIQQFVVWQFVKHNVSGESYYSTGLTKENIKTITLSNGTRACATDEQVNEAYAIYISLVNGAKEYVESEGETYSMPVKGDQTIKVTGGDKAVGENIEYDNSTNKYTIGPIRINIGDKESLLNVKDSIVITDEDNQTAEARNIVYLNENKQQISSNLKDLVGKKFYVQFTTDEELENIRVKYNVDANYGPSITSLNAYLYLTGNKQPLLGYYRTIDTANYSSGTEFSFEKEHEIDLALTKQIINIERENTGSVYGSIKRLLNYDFDKLKENNTTGYNMDKTPITVKPGDIITYKITVYNEGEEAAVVKEITDYLPEGLEFESVSTENWTATTENGKVVLKYNEGITVNSVKDDNGEFPDGEAKQYPEGTSFEVEIKCKVSENAVSKQILRNVAEITNYGYMRGTDYIEARKQNNGDRVDIDSIQGNVNVNRYNEILNELDSNNIYLNNIDKGIISQEDDDDFEQVVVGEFDLALRKFITTVNNATTVNNIELRKTREPKIRTRSALELERSGTAYYYHEKTPISVKRGDEIVYTIRVYNEGYIDGYAREIVDYLPKGLEFVDDEFNSNYGWTATVNADGTTTVKSNYLYNTKIEASGGSAGYIEMAISNVKYYKDVQIKCKVTNQNAYNGKILTNVAEISNYGYMNGTEYINAEKVASNNGADRDSEQDNVFGGNVTNTSMYYTYQKVNPIRNVYKGIQDDDDFESVVVEPFDLALRKFITQKNGNDIEESREPILKEKSALYLAMYGTAAYFHSKTPVTLKIGDTVTYTIRVYNEGYINGYAKEITDYLPSGLEFVEDSQININNGWIATKNEDGTTKVKTTKLTNTEIKASNGVEHYAEVPVNSLSEEDIFWKDVQIECKVTASENGKILTNVAEITKYGYYTDEEKNEENFVEARQTDVDQDSVENNVFNITQSVTNTEQYFNYQDIDDVNKYEDDSIKYFPGLQDDDDFENVKVEAEFAYELVLKKTDEEGNEINGAKFSITKDAQTLIDNESIQGSKTLRQEKQETNKDYIFTITENESAPGYINILGNYKIKVTTYLDANGKLQLGSCKPKISLGGRTTTSSNTNDKNYGFVILDENDNEVKDTDTDLYTKINVSTNNEVQVPQIVVTIPNEPVLGTYGLEILKVDSKDGVTPLPGVTFDVTVKKGEQEVKIYDTDGNEIITKGLVTNEQGKISIPNVRITEEAEYIYEIKETAVPAGYKMLEDTIKVTFNTIISNNKYVIDNNAKIVGDAQMQVENSNIAITVQNGQFDLALRKFITATRTFVGSKEEKKQEVTNRNPVFKIDENGNYVYEHTKEPVVVGSQNVVEYTIRVYNEGTIPGYAKEIKDDIPEGLEFLPNDELNKEYGWVMLDEKGNVVEDVNKAKYITTDYLSKEKEEAAGENLLTAFDESAYKAGKIKEPEWKEVKVAFKVTIPDGDDRIIVNQAQISDDSDENGNNVTDKDSTPDKWIEGEDDQDIEKVKVLEFDLALRKWVTKAIVIENGKETVSETGHEAEDDPEEIVKVDLKKSALDKVVVKFEYQIRVTNEGEIDGYVKEISDYIPEGLRFEAADNPQWEEVEGKIVTDQLKDSLLKPGESAEVSIILTWINREDNMGLKVNVAEISKDYNEYGTPDRDSVPNNQVPGEDDIDDAPVMLTVKTGQATLYITVAVAVLAILASGVVLIKRYVLS